jgi:hypothetical protein
MIGGEDPREHHNRKDRPMAARPTGAILAAALVAALLLGQAGDAQAHPCLVGQYSVQVPGCGPTVYDFGPGEYQGTGVWRGVFTVTVGGVLLGPGCYDLRMFNETQGTIGLRDGKKILTEVGLIDLANGQLEYMNTTYRRDPRH